MIHSWGGQQSNWLFVHIPKSCRVRSYLFVCFLINYFTGSHSVEKVFAFRLVCGRLSDDLIT